MNLALHGFLLQVLVSILDFQHGTLLCSAGEPGYLDFDNLPETNFSCQGKVIGGYYADVEAGCQMFHVCTIGQKDEIMDIKFLCLNGTVFDQETRVCERVDEVDCSKSERFYNLNLELYGNNAVTLSLHESEDEDDTEIIEDHQQRTTSARPTTTTTTTTTPRPSKQSTTVSSGSFQHPTGYPQHFQPQPPFSQVHTSQSKSLYDDKNGGFHHQYIFHNGERNNNQATSYQLFSNQGVSSTTVQAPQVHQIRFSSTAGPQIIHNEPSTVSPLFHATSSTIQTLLNSNANSPALINPIFHNHGIASTTEQFSVHSNNPRETSEYRENDDRGQSIRPLEAVQSTSKGKVSKLTISPVPTQSEPSRTVQIKTSQSSQQQRIPGNFLPTPATIETTIRSFYPTPRTSAKPSPPSQPSTSQVAQHIHIPPPPAIPQLKPHQITISLPPPDIHRIVQNPSPLLPSQSRVIVTAKASVSDESGRPLNTTQLVTLPLPTIPASYDDYKEGDESFDPFYRDVPKIRKHRRVVGEENAAGRRRKRSTLQSADRLAYRIESPRGNLTKVMNVRDKAESRTNDEIEVRNLAAIKDNLMKLRDILYKRRGSAVDAAESDSYNGYGRYNRHHYNHDGNAVRFKANESLKSTRISSTGSVKQNLDAINSEDSAEELEAGATRNFEVVEKESAGEEGVAYDAEGEGDSEEGEEGEELPESGEEVESSAEDGKESVSDEKYEGNGEEESPESRDKTVGSDEYVELEGDSKPEDAESNFDEYSNVDVADNERDGNEEIVEGEFQSEGKDVDERLDSAAPATSSVEKGARVEAEHAHDVEEDVKTEGMSDSGATEGAEGRAESITTVENGGKGSKLLEENITATTRTSDVAEAKAEFLRTTESVATEENSFTSTDVTQQFIDEDVGPKLPHILDNADAQDKLEAHKDSETPEKSVQDDNSKSEAEAEAPKVKQSSETVSEETEERTIEDSSRKPNRRKNSGRKSSRKKPSGRKQHREDKIEPTQETSTEVSGNVQKTVKNVDGSIFEEPESKVPKEIDVRAIVRQETAHPKLHEREEDKRPDERPENTEGNGDPKGTIDGGNGENESEESLEKPYAEEEHSTELTRLSEDESTERDSSEEYEAMEESPTTNISDQDYEDTSQETPNKSPPNTENEAPPRQGKSMKFEGDTSREVTTGSRRQDKSRKFASEEANEEERSTIKATEDTYDDVESSEYQDSGDAFMENDREADERDYKENSEETTVSAEYDNSEEAGDYREEEIAEDSPGTDESTVADQESSTEGVLKFTDELPKDKKEESVNRKEDTAAEVKEVAKDSVHDYVDDNYEPESYKEQESSTRSEVSSDDKTEKKVEETEKGGIKLERDGDGKEKVQRDEGKAVKEEAKEEMKEVKDDALSEGSKSEEVKLEGDEKGETDLITNTTGASTSTSTTTTTTTSTTTTTTARPTPPKLFKPISARKNYNYIPPTTTPNPVIIKPRFGLFNPKPAKPPKSYNELVPKPVIRKLPLLARKPITTTAPTVTTERDRNYTTESSKSEENILESRLESKDFQAGIANESEVVRGKEDQVPSEQNLPPPKESNDTSVKNQASTTEESLSKDPENFTPYPIARLSTLEAESKPADAAEYTTTSRSFTLMDVDVISTTAAPKIPDAVKASDIITGESLDQEENSTASSIKFYHEVTEIIQSISERPVSTSGYVAPQTDSVELDSLDATTRASGRRSNIRRHTSFNCLEKEMYRFYGDNRDCRLFHYCSPGFTSRQVLDFRFVCEEGTSFDEESQSCRHDVENRDCSNRPW